ncbi:MAG: hypothetical protein O2840_00330 [bacterium]|nr:hypothetical protein [bacterium]
MNDYIEEFFISDGVLTKIGTNRKSVLLVAFRDMQFCNGIFFNSLRSKEKIDDKLFEHLTLHLPIFSYLLTYFAAIDCLSRVWHMRSPKQGETQKFFKESAETWFGMNKRQSNALWRVRNGLSHHYNLRKDGINSTGSSPILYRKERRNWVVNITAVFGSLRLAKKKLYEAIKKLPKTKQAEFVKYIKKHCFIYTQIIVD